MTLQDVRNKYQRIVNDESLLVNSSPFRGHMNRSVDERYFRYQAISNALYVFDRYARKSSVLAWLREQLTTYQNNAGKPNAISACAIAELITDVEDAS